MSGATPEKVWISRSTPVSNGPQIGPSPQKCGASPWDWTRDPASSPAAPLRVRREINTQDATNARLYNTLDIGYRAPLRTHMDEAPIASRDTRTPATGPTFVGDSGLPAGISKNPFFGRMDITQDPRNVIREARSGVTENNIDVDLYMNNRIMSRIGATRYIPEGGDTGKPDKILESYESLRAKNSSFVTMS